MIEYLGFVYGIIKDLKEYFTYQEDVKLIDNEYAKHLENQEKTNGNNIEFHWSDEDKVSIRKTKGWDYYYEIDKKQRKKFILKNKANKILIAKKI
ncbi:MAG: hypothetical protein AB7F64_03835 [Gammaproteobacteria bacterium]